MAQLQRSANVRWTREHFLIALNLYCKLPFGKLHKGNKLIIDVARRMGRTPSSLAMKLGNFASLDPVLAARGIRGLPGATPQDRERWKEFHEQIRTLAPESEQLLHDLFTEDDDREVDLLDEKRVKLEKLAATGLRSGVTETLTTTKARRGQQFFRQAILRSFNIRCCISGIHVPRLLVASHIKPWSAFPDERLNPRNGLCLSVLHDAAFDDGLITLDEQYRLVLSKEIKQHLPQIALEQNFAAFEGQSIRLPEQLTQPDQSCLSYHREVIFKG